MVLISRLGLRAGEVATLGLDDLNWHAGTLVVDGKGGRVVTLPIPIDVGQALVDYLRDGRPGKATDRGVFTRLRPPLVALSRQGVSNVVAHLAAVAGMGTVHAHALRHTAATAVLTAGGSLRARAGPDMGEGALAMSTLEQHLAEYLSMRRALGYDLDKLEHLGGQFCTWLPPRARRRRSPPPTPSPGRASRRRRPALVGMRLGAVRTFAKYLDAIGVNVQVPPAGILPAGPRRAAPFIYSQADLQALLRACPQVFARPLQVATITHRDRLAGRDRDADR